MHSHSFKPGQAQKGVAMVEFAIALPLLLLLLLAIAEFGRMLYHYNNLLQANRDAVRYLAGKSWNTTLGQVAIDSGLSATTKNLAVYGVPVAQPGNEVVPGLSTADVTVNTVGTQHVEVSTSYVFRPVIGNGLPALIGDAIPLNFPLVATTVMRGL
ncbi:TadE/TadG family type IV pilus assembly protein [Pseudomonas sp.]|uniref:TadE/TadG family type IV pilus assembly protein n=1 Tax=Pseudomonas sp. TaxID=306 RepID=UPI002622BFBB|nr:TadE/TadG family type IV pilus assembly protein [Pseudomonas sp.]